MDTTCCSQSNGWPLLKIVDRTSYDVGKSLQFNGNELLSQMTELFCTYQNLTQLLLTYNNGVAHAEVIIAHDNVTTDNENVFARKTSKFQFHVVHIQ